MTLWIRPESDREGRAVCQFWLQGGKHNDTPTDKRIRPLRAPLGTSEPPFREKGGSQRDNKDISRCHHWFCSM